MKAPIDETELKEDLKSVALFHGEIKAPNDKVHEYFVVSDPENPGGFLAEFDDKDNCIFTTNVSTDEKLINLAVKLAKSEIDNLSGGKS